MLRFLTSRAGVVISLMMLLMLYAGSSMIYLNRTQGMRVLQLQAQLTDAKGEVEDLRGLVSSQTNSLQNLTEVVSSPGAGQRQYETLRRETRMKDEALSKVKAQLKELSERYELLQKEKQSASQAGQAASSGSLADSGPKQSVSSDAGTADVERQAAVKAAFKHSWDGYKKFAWGTDELRPQARAGHNWLGQAGSIVDSLDTLWIMGMKDDFKEARDYVVNKLSFDRVGDVSFFETCIRVLGGFLSAYDLSGDSAFLEKAKDIGERLSYAFRSPSGLPYAQVNLMSHGTSSPGWTGGSSILAEVGTVQLEFFTLSRRTGEPKYEEMALKCLDVLEAQHPGDGLYPLYIDPRSGHFTSSHVSLGAMGDSFYEYLLKLWLLSGKKHEQSKRMYYKSAQGIMDKLLKTSSPSQLLYVAEMKDGGTINKMDELACFTGGMFGLGSQWAEQPNVQLKVAKGLTETCREMFHRMPSGIAPENVYFQGNDFNAGAAYNIQRPETAESIFYLWRLTHDQKYRDWGWELFSAYEKHCKVASGGYVGIRDVNSANPPLDDTQQTFWLAETLKYLYLLFSDDSVIPLDEYVFNTEAHPLKIVK